MEFHPVEASGLRPFGSPPIVFDNPRNFAYIKCPVLGRVVSPNLAGYLVPVHADIPAIEAFCVEVHDPYVNSLGAKGVGELGITGVAAAVDHATGKRIRTLPVSREVLL